MSTPRRRPEAKGETIGGLFARLVEDAKQFAYAEIEYYRLVALRRVSGFKTAAVLIVLAVLLVQASLTTLLVGIGFAVARLIERIGLAGGVVIAGVLGLIVSAILARIAVGRIAAAGETGK